MKSETIHQRVDIENKTTTASSMIKNLIKSSIITTTLLTSGLCSAQEVCVESINLWRLIEKLNRQLSLPHPKLDTLIPQPLDNYDENEYVKFFRSSGFSISPDVKVTQLEFRTQKSSGNKIVLLSMDLSGHCIELNTVKKHYPNLTFSDFPRGHSLDEVTSLTTPPDEHGKTITFSFAEKNPDCLSKVTFNLESASSTGQAGPSAPQHRLTTSSPSGKYRGRNSRRLHSR
ncbi:hypothetical protein [Serratia entomophila]|uniref:hypothetical protein n=1 Tax=Serratia entomophila TaxID=42906 RepID=UPI0021BD6DE3|nr:hypothetical protein [Serratia entomophila]